ELFCLLFVDGHHYQQLIIFHFIGQIYSFYSDPMGLESFIRSSSLFVSISDHRELVYIELNDCNDLIDGCWHSLTIVHKAQRPSLFGSAFQTA
ncbi:unnamed protein product, partial [Rotaria socialis]